MNKKVRILVVLVFIFIGCFALYLSINKNNINVKDQDIKPNNVLKVRLGNRKDGEIMFNAELLKSYSEYKTFMENYDKDLQLNETSFKKNDYIVDFQMFSKCKEEKDKEVSEIDIKDSIMTITFKNYNQCNECEDEEIEYVAYFIPIEKGTLKELIPLDEKHENVYTDLTC